MSGPEPDAPDAHDPPWPPRPAQWRHDEPDPPGAFPVPWGVLDAVGLVLWTIVAQVLVALPLGLLGYGGDVLHAGVALVIVEAVTVAGALLWLRARGALSWRILGPLRPRWSHVLLGVGVGVVGFVIATVVPEIFRRAVDAPPPPRQQVLEAVSASGSRAWLLIVVAALLAPVVEEFVYRGVLFQALRHRLGLWPGIGLSSLTFAFVHLELVGQPIALAALLVLAAWFAAAFHRTGTLVVPVVGHMFFNGVAVALTLSLAP